MALICRSSLSSASPRIAVVDFRDLQQDLAFAADAGSIGNQTVRAAEGGGDRRRAEGRVLGGAAQSRFGFDGDAELGGNRCQRLALFDPALQLGRLRGQRVALLFRGPVGDDLFAGFVERPVARGRDLVDVEPDITVAAEIDRQGFGADLGLEGLVEQAASLRECPAISSPSASLPRGIDGVEDDELELGLVGRFLHRRAGNAGILELVMDRHDLVCAALESASSLAQLFLDVVEAANGFRLDVGDAQDDRAEGAVDDRRRSGRRP